MKILVVSDSHGDESSFENAIKKHRSAEVVIFCGDGHRDFQTMRLLHPDKAFIGVAGNCDWYCDLPFVQETELCGKKILITHGHMHGVKDGYERIASFGRSNQADIVLFGHTHKQLATVEGGMLLLNPGSIGYRGNYSIIEINEKTGRIKATEYPDEDFGPIII